MKKRLLSYMFLLVLIGFLIFLYSFSSRKNGVRKIDRLEVEFQEGKNYFLTHEMVDKLLKQNKDSINNLPKNSVDLHHLENLVLANEYVENASVSVGLGGVLRTHIKQREPLFRVVSIGKDYYIDKYNVRIPVSNHFSSRVPMVLGVNTSKEIKEVTQLISFVLEDEFLMKEIVGVQRTVKGDYILSVRSGNYKIDLGGINHLEIKFQKLKAFYNKALLNGAIKKYQTITLKYRNQVVCTKKS